MALPVAERRAVLAGDGAAERLRAAGMTWEALAGWLQGPMDAAAWEAVIPSMGYMALLRNLRNFDEAGVSDEVAERVAARARRPGARWRAPGSSRSGSWRRTSTRRSLRWAYALEQALRPLAGERAGAAGADADPGRPLGLDVRRRSASVRS